jgi:hypothetical protein
LTPVVEVGGHPKAHHASIGSRARETPANVRQSRVTQVPHGAARQTRKMGETAACPCPAASGYLLACELSGRRSRGNTADRGACASRGNRRGG